MQQPKAALAIDAAFYLAPNDVMKILMIFEKYQLVAEDKIGTYIALRCCLEKDISSSVSFLWFLEQR